jgi:hypothetical protein
MCFLLESIFKLFRETEYLAIKTYPPWKCYHSLGSLLRIRFKMYLMPHKACVYYINICDSLANNYHS